MTFPDKERGVSSLDSQRSIMTSIGASSMAGAPSGDTLVKATPCTIQHIDQGWEYKELEADITLELESTTGWTAAYHFPSEIYAELVQSGVIPHPYKTTGDTEIQCRNSCISLGVLH